MQYPNWLLRYLIFPEGIPLHVEPGNIFKKRDGTKMLNEKEQELLDSLEYEEVTYRDEEGNIIVKKVY